MGEGIETCTKQVNARRGNGSSVERAPIWRERGAPTRRTSHPRALLTPRPQRVAGTRRWRTRRLSKTGHRHVHQLGSEARDQQRTRGFQENH